MSYAQRDNIEAIHDNAIYLSTSTSTSASVLTCANRMSDSSCRVVAVMVLLPRPPILRIDRYLHPYPYLLLPLPLPLPLFLPVPIV